MKSFFAVLMSIVVLMPGAVIAHEPQDGHALEISDVWARKTRRTTSAAVYMRIHNATDKPDAILEAATPRASMTTLHMSSETDGIMRMEMQDTVALPAGETIAFEPGGLHIMLMGLDQPLEEGDVFPITLTLERAGDVTVYVEVTGLSGPSTSHH